MKHLFRYLRGAYRISLSVGDARLALDFLTANDIPFYGIQTEKDIFSFCLYGAYYKEYVRLRGKSRYRKETREKQGLQRLFARYHKRKGLLVGGILAVLLMIASSLFVWDITVTGAKAFPEAVILEKLAEKNFKLGTFIPLVNTDDIEQSFMLEMDALSFISINLRGTVASVEVRERLSETEIVDKQTPSNLIAAYDGQIEALQVTGGVCTVKIGDTVKKGTLLVSGVIDSRAFGYRLVRARGEVFARTTLTFQTEIPYENTEKVYTGRFFTKKSIKFFSKTIKLFGKDSISPTSCDKIETERRIYLFDTIKLPVFIRETRYAEYETVTKTLTESQALKKAYAEIRAMSEEILQDAEILGRHTYISENDGKLCMTQQIECMIDIAKEVRIRTDP